jgi:Ca2+-binding EF-hand superfamily protein
MTQVFLEKSPDVPEEKVDELEALLRRKYDLITGFGEAHQLSRTLQNAFMSFETLEGSMLGPREFSNAMSKMNCGDRKDVVEKMFLRYDLKAEGRFSVKSFCDGLFGLTAVPGSSPDCRAVVAGVRAKIKDRAGESGLRGLTRILRIMDDNGNKSLEKSELKSGLETYGLKLSQEELGIIFRYFDRDKSGSIDVTEFLVGIRGQMSPQREALVKQAFLKLEKTGDGRVTMEDLHVTYKADKHPAVKEGRKTKEQVMKEFAAQWNKNGDDEITLDEFLEYYNDISVSIDSDAYFELMMRNAWHLAGGKGASACTTTRRVLVTHLDGTSNIEEVEDDMGINWQDEEMVKSRLRKQGVSDILKVDVRS